MQLVALVTKIWAYLTFPCQEPVQMDALFTKSLQHLIEFVPKTPI